MSKSLNRAVRNVDRFSSHIRPDALQRRGGKTTAPLKGWNEISPDVAAAQEEIRLERAARQAEYVVPTAVFERRESEAVEPEDEYSAMARQIAAETEARRILKHHPLVVEYGFLIGDLIGQDPTQLEIVVQACESARVLGREETCKILRIEDRGQTLFSIGMQVGLVHLVLASGALKARLAEIEIEHKKKEEKKLSNSIPRRQSTAPTTPNEIPAAPSEKPEGSNELGQIELAPGVWGYVCACGCGASMKPEYAQVLGFDDMRERQGGDRAKVTDLWKHAFNPACIRGERTFPLLVTRGQIEAYDAETARRQQAYRTEQVRLEAEKKNQREQVRLEQEARRRGGSIFGETPMRQGKTARDALKKGHRRAA